MPVPWYAASYDATFVNTIELVQFEGPEKAKTSLGPHPPGSDTPPRRQLDTRASTIALRPNTSIAADAISSHRSGLLKAQNAQSTGHISLMALKTPALEKLVGSGPLRLLKLSAIRSPRCSWSPARGSHPGALGTFSLIEPQGRLEPAHKTLSTGRHFQSLSDPGAGHSEVKGPHPRHGQPPSTKLADRITYAPGDSI
jgi:hypothetical protein